MRTTPPMNPLPARDFAHLRQTVISLSWNSAGSGFESLAAHNSPGHESALGFRVSAASPRRRCSWWSESSTTRTGTGTARFLWGTFATKSARSVGPRRTSKQYGPGTGCRYVGIVTTGGLVRPTGSGARGLGSNLAAMRRCVAHAAQHSPYLRYLGRLNGGDLSLPTPCRYSSRHGVG